MDEAYCRRTIEIESRLAIQDAAVSTSVADAAVELFGLGAYIGARIVADAVPARAGSQRPSPRAGPFSDTESYFVELFTRLAGQALTRRDHEAPIRDPEGAVRNKGLPGHSPSR
jgi:hypothetical protein